MSAAIVGIGATPISSASGRTELDLALEAIHAALADAGRRPEEVDGIVRYGYDSNGFSELLQALGAPELRFFSEIPFGGSATCATVTHAAAAVQSGVASCVVCFRALNGRSGTRLGRAERHVGEGTSDLVARGEKMPGGVMTAPFGFLVPAQAMALWGQRYIAQHEVSEERFVEALGTVAVTLREYAQRNPRAQTLGRELSLAEHRDSRLIASPLRLYDLCRESDGGVALVIAPQPDGDRRAVRVLAASQHAEPYAATLPVYAPDITRLVRAAAVADLLARADRELRQIDVLGVYDGTTLNVLLALEDFGFCAPGKAVEFVLEGGIGAAGAIPTNTSGGLLSEGHVHGLNLVAEVVRQLRGESTSQVAGAATGLLTSRTSSLVLGAAQ